MYVVPLKLSMSVHHLLLSYTFPFLFEVKERKNIKTRQYTMDKSRATLFNLRITVGPKIVPHGFIHTQQTRLSKHPCNMSQFSTHFRLTLPNLSFSSRISVRKAQPATINKYRDSNREEVATLYKNHTISR